MLNINHRAIYEGKWFRTDKGAAMASSCVLKESCGVQAPGWLNGQIPSRGLGSFNAKFASTILKTVAIIHYQCKLRNVLTSLFTS